MSDQHESPIKTPKQVIIVVVVAFAVLIAIPALFSQLVTSGRKPPSEANEEQTAKLIQPVARVELAAGGGAAAQGPKSGEQIYTAVCGACHGAGVAGAPKTGDNAVWAPRIALGLDALTKSAVAGKGAMPPKGGGSDLSDTDIARAIVFMANKSGASFKEPAAPAAAAAPAAERSGEEIVKAQCYKCHETGEGGAPKMGDKQAWAPRVSRGLDTVTKSAIKGHGNMPARGGMADLTDAELTKALLYMFNHVGGKADAAPPPAPAEQAAAPAAAAAPAVAADGKGIYEKTCLACHAAGVAGAPKLGDKAAWAPRLATGADALLNSVLKGKNAMPPKGGNTALSDAEVKAAVDYMVAQSK